MEPGTRNDSRQYPDRPIVGVGAVIVQDGKVVLIRRRFEPLAGQWSLPGGTLELGASGGGTGTTNAACITAGAVYADVATAMNACRKTARS